MAALMESTEARDFSPVRAIKLCFFPSQSAALTAASSAQQRKTKSPKSLQVSHRCVLFKKSSVSPHKMLLIVESLAF